MTSNAQLPTKLSKIFIVNTIGDVVILDKLSFSWTSRQVTEKVYLNIEKKIAVQFWS